MIHNSISFREKFGLFAEQWQPKVVAEMNDYQFKIVKLQGDFILHRHEDTDEAFLVIEGELRIDLRDGAVHIGSGEMYVVGSSTSRARNGRSSSCLSNRAACPTPGTRAVSEPRQMMFGSDVTRIGEKQQWRASSTSH